ncbi:hypothetical protein CASFOL_038700 [Castilleja foliolosa]|uniref:Protein kinase domain-containing protein n=1 Tax=Castilleja foliolosa TaxID=1961234 RepID=A0ABD3BME0_9LAMI
MRVLLLLAMPIWVFSSPQFSAPVYPPVGNPSFGNDKDDSFNVSADWIARSPVAEIKVVHHHNLNKKILVTIVAASSLLGAILLLLSCFTLYRLKSLKKINAKSDHSSESAKGISLAPALDKFPYSRVGLKKGSIAPIDYQTLVVATNNFDEGKLLGEGGLGRVYKAHFNGHFQAAVKKICADWKEAERQFENEVQLLRPSRRTTLTWHMRMKIALDIARGLEYLHELCNPPVIHRDLKSSNILLDSNFNAKIADFGIAITGGSSNKANIKLTGTLGYVAPEYLLDGKLTDKSDVYAFGVILLELLMGRRPVEKIGENQCQSIVTWATPLLTDRSKLPIIVDQSIRDTMDLKHLYQVAAIAVLCVQPEPGYRPLITDVLHSLNPIVPVELGGSLRSNI